MLRQVAILAALLAGGCGPPATDIAVVTVPGAGDGPVTPADRSTTTTTGDAPASSKKVGPIPWETSEESARARAKARGQVLVVFLFAGWSAAAVTMDRVTWTDPRIVKHARSFVPLRLDVTSTDANAQAVADRFDVKSLPATVILDDLGHEIEHLEGFVTADALAAQFDRLSPPE